MVSASPTLVQNSSWAQRTRSPTILCTGIMHFYIFVFFLKIILKWYMNISLYWTTSLISTSKWQKTSFCMQTMKWQYGVTCFQVSTNGSKFMGLEISSSVQKCNNTKPCMANIQLQWQSVICSKSVLVVAALCENSGVCWEEWVVETAWFNISHKLHLQERYTAKKCLLVLQNEMGL